MKIQLIFLIFCKNFGIPIPKFEGGKKLLVRDVYFFFPPSILCCCSSGDHLAKFGNNKNMKVGKECFGGEFWFVG